MKKILLISAIAIFLASCTTIGFETPVPKNTETINTFPKELIGTYFDGEKDTLIITENSFNYGRPDSTIFYMSEKLEKGKVELKKFDEYFILNKKSEKDEIWGIIPFKINNGVIEVFFANLDTKKNEMKAEGDTTEIKTEVIIEQINKITPVKSVNKENTDEKDYIVNPTNEELRKLLDEGYFVKVLDFYRIK